MIDLPDLSANLVLALTAYLVGTASPGPSNLAIMAAALTQGRARAVTLAAGVITGSVLWGFAAAFGLSSLMHSYSWSLVVMKILGGAYMLWLSWKAARQALAPAHIDAAPGAGPARLGGAYLQGLSMHLTNPKAIFVWLSIVALALPPHAQRADAFLVVAGCGLIGATVFVGYALAFSTEGARRGYRRVQRAFHALLSIVFAYAGLRMLLSRHDVA